MPNARLQQAPSEESLTAALLIAEAFDVLGQPRTFADWLRRIAADFDEDSFGEVQGMA